MLVNPQIIVATPTLGRSEWLKDTVESVARFRWGGQRLRHILVAPSDRGADLAATYPQVEVVSEETDRGGLYEAINYGVLRDGDWRWMTYLNDDDVLQAGFETVLSVAENDPVDILYGRVTYIDAEGRRLGQFPVESRPERMALLMGSGIPPLTQQGTLVQRSCFEALGGFNPQYELAADFDFWVRAVSAGRSFHFLPHEVGSFRLRQGQLSVDQDKAMAEKTDIISRHLDPPGSVNRALIRAEFRLRHTPEILLRRLRTGRWRTGASIGGRTP